MPKPIAVVVNVLKPKQYYLYPAIENAGSCNPLFFLEARFEEM